MYADMDGILCTNDDLAVGVLQECLASGISVPQELAIAGFHGLEIGQIVSPRLASVLTPRFEMGKVATEILIKKIKGLPTIEKSGPPLPPVDGRNDLTATSQRLSCVSERLMRARSIACLVAVLSSRSRVR